MISRIIGLVDQLFMRSEATKFMTYQSVDSIHFLGVVYWSYNLGNQTNSIKWRICCSIFVLLTFSLCFSQKYTQTNKERLPYFRTKKECRVISDFRETNLIFLYFPEMHPVSFPTIKQMLVNNSRLSICAKLRLAAFLNLSRQLH